MLAAFGISSSRGKRTRHRRSSTDCQTFVIFSQSSPIAYDDMIAGVARMQRVGTILSSPVIAGRVVYFGSNDGNLYALR